MFRVQGLIDFELEVAEVFLALRRVISTMLFALMLQTLAMT